MRIAVIGDRNFTEDDKNTVIDTINLYVHDVALDKNVVFVIGGAPGVDTWVKESAKENRDDYIVFLPYHRLDKKAEFQVKYFFIRNRQIISNSDAVIVIHSWRSEEVPSDLRHAEEFANKKNKILKTCTV